MLVAIVIKHRGIVIAQYLKLINGEGLSKTRWHIACTYRSACVCLCACVRVEGVEERAGGGQNWASLLYLTCVVGRIELHNKCKLLIRYG